MTTYNLGGGEAAAYCHPNGTYTYPTVSPPGHPRFHEILQELADLHDRKNYDYTAGGKPTGNFDRVSSLLTKYPGFPVATPYGVAIIYMLKQLDAILWMLSQGHESQTGEDVEQRLKDVANYAVLAELMYEERYLVDSPESDS